MSRLTTFIKKYKNADVIFKATIWFVLVTVVDNCISIITQPFVNRILTVEDVGVYHVFTTWTGFLRIVASFSLYCGVYEVLLGENKKEQKQLQGSLCILSVLFMAVCFGIVAVFINPVSSQLQLKPAYILLMFFMIFSDVVIQFFLIPFRYDYKYITFSVFTVGLFLVKSITTIACAYLFVSDRVFGRIFGLVAPSFILATIFFIIIIKNTKFKSLTKYWKEGVKFNIPLIPHYLSSILLDSSDKVMIQKFAGEFYVGLYSLAYSFANLSKIIFTAINNSYTPWAYDAIRQKNYSDLKKKTNTIIFISIMFCIALMLMAPEGILILGGQKYMQALNLVPVLVAGTFLSSFYFVFSNVAFVYKKTKMVFPITITGALLNISLNFIFIPLFGYEAAAYTTFIGYLYISGCHYLYSRKVAGQSAFDIKAIIGMIIMLTGAMFACMLIYKIHFILRYLLVAALAFITVMLFYKNGKKFKE